MVATVGVTEQHGAEQAPARWDAEPPGQLGLSPEGAQDAGAQPGVDRPQEDGHQRGKA